MTYIRHREGLVGRHEVVVLHVGGDVDVGPGTARFADQRGPGPGADRHAAHPGCRYVTVPYDAHLKPPLDDPHKLHGVNSFRQFAHDAEPRAVPGLRRLENPKVPHAQHFRQLMPPGALSRLVWQA